MTWIALSEIRKRLDGGLSDAEHREIVQLLVRGPRSTPTSPTMVPSRSKSLSINASRV